MKGSEIVVTIVANVKCVKLFLDIQSKFFTPFIQNILKT